MRIRISNLRIDGSVHTHWDALLRVVSEVKIEIDRRLWYEEEELCVVELAAALHDWRSQPARSRGAFVYTSIESEEDSLIAFTPASGGSWAISSPHQNYIEEKTFSTAELDALAEEFLEQLGSQLPERERVLALLAEREEAHAFLEMLSRSRRDAGT